jgi:hypothetical protein
MFDDKAISKDKRFNESTSKMNYPKALSDLYDYIEKEYEAERARKR